MFIGCGQLLFLGKRLSCPMRGITRRPKFSDGGDETRA